MQKTTKHIRDGSIRVFFIFFNIERLDVYHILVDFLKNNECTSMKNHVYLGVLEEVTPSSNTFIYFLLYCYQFDEEIQVFVLPDILYI